MQLILHVEILDIIPGFGFAKCIVVKSNDERKSNLPQVRRHWTIWRINSCSFDSSTWSVNGLCLTRALSGVGDTQVRVGDRRMET
jgi:hypothetical protein